MSKRMMAMLVVMTVGVLQPAFGPVVSAQAREGIKVHGHWVIDVRNPDGTLSSHTEFENALMPDGALLMAGILTRTVTEIRGWTIVLTPNQGRPFGSNLFTGEIIRATIVEEAFQPTADNGFSPFGTLTAAKTGSTVVLKGTATAIALGQINRVDTSVVSVNQSGPSSSTFSGTVLPTPVSLAAGQIVQVTVTLSFS